MVHLGLNPTRRTRTLRSEIETITSVCSGARTFPVFLRAWHLAVEERRDPPLQLAIALKPIPPVHFEVCSRGTRQARLRDLCLISVR